MRCDGRMRQQGLWRGGGPKLARSSNPFERSVLLVDGLAARQCRQSCCDCALSRRCGGGPGLGTSLSVCFGPGAGNATPVRLAVETRDGNTAAHLMPMPDSIPQMAAMVRWARALGKLRTATSGNADAEQCVSRF